MKNLIITAASILTFAAAMPAYASDDAHCGTADRSSWMSEEALKMKATEMGYDVKKVKVEEGCFEIYAIKDGKRVEAYLHPVTAEIIRVKSDD